MPITVTCPGCHCRIRADDRLVGKHANCGKCGRQIYIEPPTLDSGDGEMASSTSDYQLSPVEERLPHSHPEAPQSGRPKRPDDPLSCPKCTAPLSPGQEHCQSCYYHSGLNRVVDTRNDDEREGRAPGYGFRRYLQQKLSKDQSPESVFRLLDFFFALLLLAIATWLSVPFYIGLTGVGVYISYRVFVQTSGNAYRGNSVLWRAVLMMGRGLEWKTFSGSSRRASTHRQRSFDDAALAGVEGCAELQVLDLEGTGITDAGLKLLQHHSHLEFLILRRTQVTEDGVWELQQTIPTTCIWY
jgi:hypothetical protein